MNKSESIQNLASALCKAQAEFPAIEFDSVNPFLKNGYASLGANISGTRPALTKNGLSVTQLTFGEDGVIGVETMLLHSSGEWISDRVSMQAGEERGKSNAQVAGSIVTYLRRYALASILGIYADEDGDGAKPQPAELKAREEKKPVESKPVAKADEPKADDTMTIEDACKTTTSQGKAYGEMNIAGLKAMLSAMYAKIAKNGLSPEDKAEVERKIKMAQVVLAAKVNKEI